MNPQRVKSTADQADAIVSASSDAAGGNDAARGAQQAAQPLQTARQSAPAPAVREPHHAPAVPRDGFHGRGGRYALIDGKRAPIAEDDNPVSTQK